MSKKIYTSIDKDILSRLHNAEIEIFKEIIRICEKHNLKWFLVAGSLLGAVRHKGFIPWDDDIDIGMYREDYDKFIDIAINEIDDKFFVHCNKTDPNYWCSFLKIRKNNTIFEEEHLINKKTKHNGIFVDIFPYDNAANIYIFNRIRCFVIRFISDNLLIKNKIFNYKESRYKYLNIFLKFIPKKILIKIQNHLMTSKKRGKYVVNWVGASHVKNELIKYCDFFPLVNVKFEKIECKAFRKYKTYLSNVYGNYMKIPPKSQRVNHGSAYISFKKGKNYISKNEVI